MDYETFIAQYEQLTGIRLRLYKDNQMRRRINTLIERKGLSDYAGFWRLITTNPRELDYFTHYITINVTEFFRTPKEWQVFENTVLKSLAENSSKDVRIWSSACSTGEEPYSLAMSLSRYRESEGPCILATDLDTEVLWKAQAGAYAEQSVAGLTEEIKEQFFIKEGLLYRVRKEIRDMVAFRHFDLLCEEYPENMDVIVCRNVLIYFTDEAKELLYKKFYESLKPGGYLFTGNTEQIIYYKKFGYKKIENFLYQKPKKGNL